MKEPALPTAPDLLVRPLHLAGPGTGSEDIVSDLVDHFGWRRPRNPYGTPILRCPQGRAWLTRRFDFFGDSSGWEVDISDPTWTRVPWSVSFDDAAPGEITATVLSTLAHRLEYSPWDAYHPAPGWDGALAVLCEAGWALGQRDGHDVLLAPDRLAALTRPLHSDNPSTVLTGAASHGTWKVTFSSHAPAFLLHSAAAALLRPALRSAAEVPSAHQERMSLEPLPPSPGPRVLVSPRYLAGPAARGPLPPRPSGLWHAAESGQVVSSCGRARVTGSPEDGLRVSARPKPLDFNSEWRAHFTPSTPAEITDDWLDFLTDSVAADIDLGTAYTFSQEEDITLGEVVEPLTSAGWSAHSGATRLRLVAPGGYASASISHGRGLNFPQTTTAEALASRLQGGADFYVSGAPGRWQAHLSRLTPPYLVRALVSVLADPAPLLRDGDRIPRQLLTSVRLAATAPQLSSAAAASRVRSRRTAPAPGTAPADPRRTPPAADPPARRTTHTR
ncbi:hypothetical protein [Kitasatospora sp. NPDC088783]|uniref:hypothetical protein n=1 Tax=Kitasatospora sp. NPDC088783 TaxID=3364077 RepID=UPI003810B00F